MQAIEPDIIVSRGDYADMQLVTSRRDLFGIEHRLVLF